MALTFAVLVTGSPYQSQAHLSAQRFIEALYRQGHSVSSVFFYGDGVYVANSLINPANDEVQQHLTWKNLANQYQFKLQACVSVANKRGILSEEDSELAGLESFNVSAPFEVSGLGSWVEASTQSDRSLHFS